VSRVTGPGYFVSRRRQPRFSNDNERNATGTALVWDVYRAAARARWVGQVVACSADEAIETAAVEFHTEG
jgi:hypothetical protein